MPPDERQARVVVDQPGLVAHIEELYAAQELRLAVTMDYLEEQLLLEFAGVLGVLRDALQARIYQTNKSLAEMARSYLTSGKG